MNRNKDSKKEIKEEEEKENHCPPASCSFMEAPWMGWFILIISPAFSPSPLSQYSVSRHRTKRRDGNH